MKKKRLVILSLVLLFAVPALAVFNEKDLGHTLSVLRYELSADYSRMSKAQESINRNDMMQHMRMVGMIKKCNELSLMLYSQKQDFTFDMTYALKEVTREYEDFNSHKMPFDDIVARLDLEIDRFSRLVESLRRLPPQIRVIEDLPDSLTYHNDSVDFSAPLIAHHHDHGDIHIGEHHHEGMPGGHIHGDGDDDDDDEDAKIPHGPFVLDEQGQVDRDSCLFYATSLLKMYSEMKTRIVEDNEYYDNASDRLKESYDYAQDRYKVLQKRIFIDGQGSYLKVIKRLGWNWKRAMQDIREKYSANIGLHGETVLRSEWKGPMVFSFVAMLLGFIIAACILSLVLVTILNKSVKKFKGRFSGDNARCLAMLLASAILASTLMVAKQFAHQNFFAVACPLLLVLSWLMAAIFLSLYIRLKKDQMRAGMNMYAPVIVSGIIIIVFRIVFIPNSFVNIVLPPLMLLFLAWQAVLNAKYRKILPQSDAIMGWISFLVFAIAFGVAVVGYVFLAILLLVWWLFQAACVETIIAAYILLNRYEDDKLVDRLKAENGGRKPSRERVQSGEFISVTWFFDLVNKSAAPMAAILSIPFCLKRAADVFDFTETFKDLFYSPMIALYDTASNPILHVSLFKVVLMASLFFAFRYVNYVVKALYRDIRLAAEVRRNGGNHVHTNQINFTLADNIISILVWGIFLAALIIVWKIPVGAISVVFAGLATGIGLAMKDILNNFIYGIQLMSGRLRVGDWVECDGVRGKVAAISYQSTQIETIDGAVMSFLNSALFSKNFKNLTRNNSYEFVKIVVGVSYGSDVSKVRELLLDGLETVRTKDAYGRDIVDAKKGISVVFEDFGDSSVDIAVKQYVLVSERANYIANAKEVIYNTLNAGGIEIPFPQRDIHVITSEGK